MTVKQSLNPRQRLVLSNLVTSIEAFLVALDQEMRLPSSFERGQRIARLANALGMEKDLARFAQYGLDVDFRTGKRRRRERLSDGKGT